MLDEDISAREHPKRSNRNVADKSKLPLLTLALMIAWPNTLAMNIICQVSLPGRG